MSWPWRQEECCLWIEAKVIPICVICKVHLKSHLKYFTKNHLLAFLLFWFSFVRIYFLLCPNSINCFDHNAVCPEHTPPSPPPSLPSPCSPSPDSWFHQPLCVSLWSISLLLTKRPILFFAGTIILIPAFNLTATLRPENRRNMRRVTSSSKTAAEFIESCWRRAKPVTIFRERKAHSACSSSGIGKHKRMTGWWAFWRNGKIGPGAKQQQA